MTRYGSFSNGKKRALLQQNSQKGRQLATKSLHLATKSRKVQVLRKQIGDVKVPENPVAILIGNSCADKRGNYNIYGDRDMKNLKLKLEKWCPGLKPDDDEEEDKKRILLLTNKPHATVVQQILKFVDSEIFKNADFIFFGCSTHGAEDTEETNKTGRHCNAISDSKGKMMLFEGSKEKPGIVDLIEHYSDKNALRLYLYGACRTPFNEAKLRITDCIDFAEKGKDYVQKELKGGHLFLKPCNFKQIAYAAKSGESFSPWLKAIVKIFDNNPGRKIIDVFRDAEKELDDKSKENPKEGQTPCMASQAFKYSEGDAVFQDTLSQSDDGGMGNYNYLTTSNNNPFDNDLNGSSNNNFGIFNEGISSSTSSPTAIITRQQSPGSISSFSSIMPRKKITKKQNTAKSNEGKRKRKRKRKTKQGSLEGSEDDIMAIILRSNNSKKTDDQRECFNCRRMVPINRYWKHFIDCKPNQTNEQASSETSVRSNNNNASDNASDNASNKIESQELFILSN